MKKVLTILLAVMSISLVAQESTEKVAAKFDKTTHDFGIIKEEEGKVVCTFEFTNTLKKAISIKKIVASCGCTTPTHTNGPIAADAAGKVEVTYNAAGRPGRFKKSVSVTFSDGTNDYLQTIFISGEVLAKGTNSPEKRDVNPAILRR